MTTSRWELVKDVFIAVKDTTYLGRNARNVSWRGEQWGRRQWTMWNVDGRISNSSKFHPATIITTCTAQLYSNRYRSR